LKARLDKVYSLLRIDLIETNEQELRVAIAQVQREPTPTSPEQQEAFFQECVAEGEKLATMGAHLFPIMFEAVTDDRSRETG
jgi:hypothetical protein